MKRELSVVVPAYNAASWLPKSIPRTEDALKAAKVRKAEILIINDGSIDDTEMVAANLNTHYPLRVINQPNSGRFLARKTGTDQAKYQNILFIDTRIYIAKNGLKFIFDEIEKKPDRKVWTSHVYLDKSSNIYARFWDSITFIAWRKYFKNPRDYSYGIEQFDRFPKGTTCFFVPKKIIQSANNWFINNTKDLKTSNDDTLLIRHIAEQTNININPIFSCTYHARTNFKQFFRHVYHRGQVFVDGFLRNDGNIFYYPLILFLLFSISTPILLVIFPQYLVLVLVTALALWVTSPAIMILLGVPPIDALSTFMLLPAFIVSYGAGIWKAFYKLQIKGR